MNVLLNSTVIKLKSMIVKASVLEFHSHFTRSFTEISNSFKYSDLNIQLIKKENEGHKPNSDDLVFGRTFSDHMLEVEWTSERGWGKPLIRPLQNLSLHPASKVLHYAQELFEGMKAFKSKTGQALLFRPDMNMKRMLLAAERAALPKFDGDELLKCLKKLVAIDQHWIPDKEGCSLYVRPTFIGIDPSLGVGASKKALLYVITCPVGAYFPSGQETAISLLADPNFVRAWPGGVGHRKMGCNYAPTIRIQQIAESQNLQQVLWLSGNDHHLAEVGTMNIFVYLINSAGEHELITPPLDGTILPGVMRNSLLDLAHNWNESKVSERQISMKEVIQAKTEGRLLEIFGSGTACVVCPVGTISYMNETITIPTLESRKPMWKRFLQTLTDIQYGKVPSEWSVPINEM